MLLQHFYRISLERPAHLMCFIGRIDIDLLRAWMGGHESAWGLIKGQPSDASDFFKWLRDTRGEFPPQGWPARNLSLCDGDHARAIKRFWGLLHEYLLAEIPEWFVEINSRPIESLIRNGLGEPASLDLRLPEHRDQKPRRDYPDPIDTRLDSN